MRHSKQSIFLPRVFAKRFIFGSLAGLCMSIFVTAVTALVFIATSSFPGFLIAGPPNVIENDAPAVKKVGDYRKDLKAFVKQSKSKDDVVRYGAVLNLCLLHQEIVNDDRYDSNLQLQGFRAVAADRLKKCKKEIELQLLRDQRAKKKQSRGATKVVQSGSDPELTESSEFTFQHYENMIAQDMQSMTLLTGGPINLWKYTGNPAGPLCDYGPELVNLIQNTIDPDFWRSNGGNGIIEYYQPLRIIVVGASSQIHDDMTDLLNTLRYNGR